MAEEYNKIQIEWCKERFTDLRNSINTIFDQIIPNIHSKIDSINSTLLKRDSDIKTLNTLVTEIYGNGKAGLKTNVDYLMRMAEKKDRIQTLILGAFSVQVIIHILNIIVSKIN